MGTYKSKIPKQDVNENTCLEEEPFYVIKTRSPRPGPWSLNIMRGKREDDLRNIAYSLARRKCYRKVLEFTNCENRKNMIYLI